jgi:hypothetical protein
MLKRRVLGVAAWTGREGGSSSPALVEGRTTSLDVGRRPSSDTAMRPASGLSPASSTRASLSPRLKKLAGSRVLRRLRFWSLRPGRSALKGITAHRLAAHLRGVDVAAQHIAQRDVVWATWVGRVP